MDVGAANGETWMSLAAGGVQAARSDVNADFGLSDVRPLRPIIRSWRGAILAVDCVKQLPTSNQMISDHVRAWLGPTI